MWISLTAYSYPRQGLMRLLVPNLQDESLRAMAEEFGWTAFLGQLELCDDDLMHIILLVFEFIGWTAKVVRGVLWDIHTACVAVLPMEPFHL